MLRLTIGGLLGGFVLASSLAFAQVTAPARISYAEPPPALPGEFKEAPPETTVIPGQPAPLPQQLVRPPAPQRTFAPDQGSSPPASGVQPAQYVTPAVSPAPPKAPAPAVLYPEPPTPSVKISIKGLDTAATGQDLTYRLTVTNTSDARAFNVIARCPVPRGTKFVKGLPEPKADDKELEWNLGTLEVGASRQIEVVFKPNPETTEVAVVGKVQFEHGRVIKTKLANPMLEMRKTSPAQGILHEPMTFKIVLTNPGKVPVTDLQIVDTLPEGLEYVQETSNGAIPVSKVGPKPNQRTWTLGMMKPKETQTIEYRVMPSKLGDWTSQVEATALGVHEKAGCNTVVHEGRITLQVEGPASNKGTANQATPCLIHVHNQGTATLHNVRVICSFPNEIRLAKASNDGHLYKDAVQWMILSLEPNETKDVSLSLIAPSAGLRDLVVSARADKGLEQRQKVSIAFEGTPALNWQTEGTPVASIGQDVVYTVKITNPGSAPAKNVKIVADLSELVEFRQAQPDFQRGQGAVFFNPVEVPAKQSVTLKITCVAKKAGEARFQFEMTAEGMGSGPLKQSKVTTINPSGGPKEIDPSRIGAAPPKDQKPERKELIPVGGTTSGEIPKPTSGADKKTDPVETPKPMSGADKKTESNNGTPLGGSISIVMPKRLEGTEKKSESKEGTPAKSAMPPTTPGMLPATEKKMEPEISLPAIDIEIPNVAPPPVEKK